MFTIDGRIAQWLLPLTNSPSLSLLLLLSLRLSIYLSPYLSISRSLPLSPSLIFILPFSLTLDVAPPLRMKQLSVLFASINDSPKPIFLDKRDPFVRQRTQITIVFFVDFMWVRAMYARERLWISLAFLLCWWSHYYVFYTIAICTCDRNGLNGTAQ